MNEKSLSSEPVPSALIPHPLVLSAVQADEALVESLRNAVRSEAGAADGELAGLVLAWKREIESVPFPEQPDLGEAEAALRRGTGRAPRPRLLTPIAAAAAAVGIALSGVALLAHDSRPGDPLWGVTQVVFADHARSVAAVTEAQANLTFAERALAAGSPEAARAALGRVGVALHSVDSADGRAELGTLYATLSAHLKQVGVAPHTYARTSVPPVTTTSPLTSTTTPESVTRITVDPSGPSSTISTPSSTESSSPTPTPSQSSLPSPTAAPTSSAAPSTPATGTASGQAP